MELRTMSTRMSVSNLGQQKVLGVRDDFRAEEPEPARLREVEHGLVAGHVFEGVHFGLRGGQAALQVRLHVEVVGQRGVVFVVVAHDQVAGRAVLDLLFLGVPLGLDHQQHPLLRVLPLQRLALLLGLHLHDELLVHPLELPRLLLRLDYHLHRVA
jgi:hypothetical protein